MTLKSISRDKLSKLVSAALDARNRAYAPYSNFRVGAALLTSSGDVIIGCNVENASYGATICAERNAIFSAIAAGHTRFEALCVAGDTGEAVVPCGICRQVMTEFNDGLVVICSNKEGKIKRYCVEELLPYKFELKNG